MDQFDLLRQNIKIVFTFREDYLAEFERPEDRSFAPSCKTACALTPMRGDRAAEAIQQAGGGPLERSRGGAHR